MTGITRDGFEVVRQDTGEVIHFFPCNANDSRRERVERGCLRKVDLDRFFVRDTRLVDAADNQQVPEEG